MFIVWPARSAAGGGGCGGCPDTGEVATGAIANKSTRAPFSHAPFSHASLDLKLFIAGVLMAAMKDVFFILRL